MPAVFISYAREDIEITRGLAKTFEANDISVWWDDQLKPGDRFRRAIADQLRQADAVVVIWSSHAATSDYVVDEAEYARHNKMYIPVCVDGFNLDQLPVGFRGYHVVSFRDTYRILDALGTLPAAQRAIRIVGKSAPGDWRTSELFDRSGHLQSPDFDFIDKLEGQLRPVIEDMRGSDSQAVKAFSQHKRLSRLINGADFTALLYLPLC